MQTPIRIRPAASFPLKFDELESSGSTTSTGVHSLSVELSHRWLAGGTGSRTGSLGPVAPLWVECPNDRKFFKINDKNSRRRQDLNRGWRFCSAQRRPKTKGTLRVLLRFSRLTWLTLGWFWLTTAQDWAQPPRAHPCLCAHATGVGSCCGCTSTAAASATRMAARATIGALRTAMGCSQTTTTMLG